MRSSLTLMSLPRRRFLLGSLAWASGLSAAGAMTASCGRLGLPGGSASPKGGYLPPEKVEAALRDLVRQAGREAFQSVSVDAYSAGFGGGIDADLLMPNGVQRFTYEDRRWKKDTFDEKSILTSPVSVRIADLPLDRLPAFTRAARMKPDTLTFTVGYVGKIRVSSSPESGDDVGLKPDASGRVPHLDPDDVAGVRAAVAEIVAAYGREAERIGSFNGFVHIDGNVAGCRAGVRIVRRPSLAAAAVVEQGKPYHRGLLLDPTRFDPTTAVTRKATIAKEAHVKGKVWDWEYRRPSAGRPPLLSYGIGTDGPSTRVWLNEHGRIAKVDTGHCKKTPGWCPG